MRKKKEKPNTSLHVFTTSEIDLALQVLASVKAKDDASDRIKSIVYRAKAYTHDTHEEVSLKIVNG